MSRGNFASARRRCSGFSLVAAIFILVVLAALGAFMVTIGELGRRTAVGAAQGARAYEAANAGLEWGIATAVPFGGGFSCPAGVSPTFTVGTFTVAVTRTPAAGNPYTDGTAVNVCTIMSEAVSTGLAPGDPDYFSRTLQVTVTDAPSP